MTAMLQEDKNLRVYAFYFAVVRCRPIRYAI